MGISKNFISQRCGRAVASFAWEDGQAVVTIAFTEPILGTLRFVVDDLPAAQQDQEELQEQALRIAIGRLHRKREIYPTAPRSAVNG